MDTQIIFNPDEWDELADISTIHLTYLIQCLLPLRLIEWKTTRRHYDGVVSDVRSKTNADSDMECVVTGSTAEGFAIPNCLAKSSPPHVIRFADVDMLIMAKSFHVSTVDLPSPNNTESKAYFDSEGIHPGYTRLCLPTFKNPDNAFIFDEVRKKYYFSSADCKERILKSKIDLEPSETAFIHGPALSIEDSSLLSLANWGDFNAGSSRDLVSAIKCDPWPKEASGWKQRALKSAWLKDDFIENIIKDGCHVVAVPSKNSPKPDLEWRISFSASEGKLARQAVTDNQRQCYIYLKILRYQTMKPVSVLSSYVFKSVFLHSCEKLPVDNWVKFPGNCILYMLDVILECLRKKFVPTYFLPENNLIDFLNDEELDAAMHAVEAMRSDPIGPVLDFTDDKTVGLLSVLLPFRKLVEPLLNDIQNFKKHRNKTTSIMRGILPTAVNFCQSLLFEAAPGKPLTEKWKHKEAVRYIIDAYKEWLLQTDYKASLAQCIDEYGLSIKNQTRKIRFYEAVISLTDEYPEFNAARGNLACSYHACAYSVDNRSNPTAQADFLKKAEDLFEKVYNENKGSVIDYITFLVKQKRFEKSISILEEYLEDSVDKTCVVIYDKSEIETLEDPLKNHVLEHGKIVSDAVSFAYFYFVKCKCAMTTSTVEDMVGVLKKFEKHCEMQASESSTQLFTYAKSFINCETEKK